MERSSLQSPEFPDVAVDALVTFTAPDVRLQDFIRFDAPDVKLTELTIFDTEVIQPPARVWEWVQSLASTVLFVLVFTTLIAQATQVPTESMKPTILVGDHFFLDKVAFPGNFPETIRPFLPRREINRGDIIAFRPPIDPTIPYVKRVIGIGGDTVEVRDRIVILNGEAIDEPYKIHTSVSHYSDGSNYGPVEVPPDEFFVMGDNRDNSSDSRVWGFVRREDIIGKPLFVYWSYESDPYIPGDRSWRERGQEYLSIAMHFFSRTRWFRMGTMVQ
jgi:signal peptidase I